METHPEFEIHSIDFILPQPWVIFNLLMCGNMLKPIAQNRRIVQGCKGLNKNHIFSGEI